MRLLTVSIHRGKLFQDFNPLIISGLCMLDSIMLLFEQGPSEKWPGGANEVIKIGHNSVGNISKEKVSLMNFEDCSAYTKSAFPNGFPLVILLF